MYQFKEGSVNGVGSALAARLKIVENANFVKTNKSMVEHEN